MTVVAALFWTTAFVGAAAALVSALPRDARDRTDAHHHHRSDHHRTGSSS